MEYQKSNNKSGAFVKSPKPIGYLIHKPTHSYISVFTKIGWFRRLMIRICFDIQYRNN